MSDCRKIYFGTTGEPKSHRIVYQDGPSAGDIEILELVAVEARDDGYVYLQAAKRLGRLPAESEAQLERVHPRPRRQGEEEAVALERLADERWPLSRRAGPSADTVGQAG